MEAKPWRATGPRDGCSPLLRRQLLCFEVQHLFKALDRIVVGAVPALGDHFDLVIESGVVVVVAGIEDGNAAVAALGKTGAGKNQRAARAACEFAEARELALDGAPARSDHGVERRRRKGHDLRQNAAGGIVVGDRQSHFGDRQRQGRRVVDRGVEAEPRRFHGEAVGVAGVAGDDDGLIRYDLHGRFSRERKSGYQQKHGR